MRTPISRLPAPTTYAREPDTGRCRRNCCWTPYGHSNREGCTCHMTPLERVQRAARIIQEGGAS